MIRIKTAYYLHSAKKPVVPVYIYLTIGRMKKIVHSTSIKVNRSDWDNQAQRLKRNSRQEYKNIELDDFEAETRRVVRQFINQEKQKAKLNGDQLNLNREDIKNQLKLMSGDSIEETISMYDYVIRRATQKDNSNMRALVYHFKNYCKVHPTPTFNTAKLSFFESFTEYLASQKSMRGKKGECLSTSYINVLIASLKRIMSNAVVDGLSQNVIFKEIKTAQLIKHKKNSEHIYLNFEQIRKIADLDISVKRLAETRARFLAACFHGLRHSDWHKLNDAELETVGGVEFARIETDKGKGQISFVPVNDIVKEAIGLETVSINAEITRIKELGKMAGLNKMGLYRTRMAPMYQAMGTHTARRSFESNMRALGCPQNLIDLVTTHGNTSISDIYDRRDLAEKAKGMSRYIMLYEKYVFGKQAFKVA